MTQDIRSHCIGRYLIDLPADYELSTGRPGDATLYFGKDEDVEKVEVTVKTGTYTDATFFKSVQQSQADLQSALNEKAKTPMLIHSERIGDQAFLLRRHAFNSVDSSIRSELHQLVSHRYVVVIHDSYPPMGPRGGFVGGSASVNVAPAEQRLKTISKALKPYTEALRATPTFCMQDVVFDFPYDAASGTFYFFGTQHPDVQFELGYNEVFASRPEETLFDRMDKLEANLAEDLAQAGARTLRRTTPTVNGRPAQEHALKIERPDVVHRFALEVRAEDWHNPNQPYLLLGMDTGLAYTVAGKSHRAGDSSLNDQQALALWDSVRSSLRLRKAPYVGTLYCDFELPCPRDGVWQLALKPNVAEHIATKYGPVERLNRWSLSAGRILPTPNGIAQQDLRWWEWELSISRD